MDNNIASMCAINFYYIAFGSNATKQEIIGAMPWLLASTVSASSYASILVYVSDYFRILDFFGKLDYT